MQRQEDYPSNFEEFLEMFQTEDDCLEYIRRIRWPDTFICPKCGSTKAWKTKRGTMRCTTCNVQTSITGGTVFNRTRKPLRGST